MQAESLWIKNLARAKFKDGQWITDVEPLSGDGPYAALLEAIVLAIEVYNKHAASPVRVLNGATKSHLSLCLVHGAAQVKFTRNGPHMDVSLTKTKNFQSNELPLARLTPVVDKFGMPTWMRGTTEWSTDQLIKHALIHLLEASQSV